MKSVIRQSNILILLSLALFLGTACQEKSFNPEDPADVFAKASEPYSDGLYDIALKKLGEFKSRFPYSKHATKAELMMADCHFRLGNFQEAAYSYSQFAKLHPRHPELDFVYFRIGESHWVEAPEDIDREQDLTRKAVKEWQHLISNYPSSKYTKEAEKKVKLGVARIADSKVLVMNFYCKQKRYHSCAYKALIILDEFKTFPKVRKKALQQAAKSFAALAKAKSADPEDDSNVYVKSMTVEELKEKAATFKRLSEDS